MDNNVSSCFNISDQQLKVAALTRGITGLVCFVLCFVTFVFEIVFICRLKKTSTLLRLYVCLTVSTLLYLTILSLHIEHYFRYTNQETFCKVIGALYQYTGSAQLIFILGITLVLFHKIFSLSGPYRYIVGKLIADSHYPRLCCGYCLEFVVCVSSIFLPLLVIWIPFLRSEGGYGVSGPWCWIQTKDPNCTDIPSGILEQNLLWYVPFELTAGVSLLCIVYVIVFFCYLRVYRGFLVQRIQNLIKEMLLLMTFLVVYYVVAIVEGCAQTIFHDRQDNLFALWMVYAVISPIGAITVLIGFFLYLFCSKNVYSSSPNSRDVTIRIRTFTDFQTGKVGDRFIHNPSRISQPSNTSDRDSKFFLFRSGSETSSQSSQTQPLI